MAIAGKVDCTLISKAGGAIEKIQYDGRTIFRAKPGEEYFVRVRFLDVAYFRTLLELGGLNRGGVWLGLYVDGIKQRSLILRSQERFLRVQDLYSFKYTDISQRTYVDTFLQFVETTSINTDDTHLKDINAAQKWDKSEGTIELRWYAVAIEGEEEAGTPYIAEFSKGEVGNTKKFYDRPSAHSMMGSCASPRRKNDTFLKTRLIPETEASHKVWYHEPLSYQVYKNLAEATVQHPGDANIGATVDANIGANVDANISANVDANADAANMCDNGVGMRTPQRTSVPVSTNVSGVKRWYCSPALIDLTGEDSD